MAVQEPVRRPDDDAAQCRIRRRAGRAPEADAQRSTALHPSGRGRGQRDDGPADRLAGQGSRRAPRPTARDRAGSFAAESHCRRDAALRADGDRMSPVGWQTDFECYGTTVPAGSAMLLLFGAANRDPRRYTDPDSFNIHRDNISHITFGRVCITAWAPTSPGWRAASPWTRSSTAGPSGDIDYDTAQLASTSTVRGWEQLRIAACPEHLSSGFAAPRRLWDAASRTGPAFGAPARRPRRDRRRCRVLVRGSRCGRSRR